MTCTKIFQKCINHVNILCAIRVMVGKFRIADPHGIDNTVQNFASRMIRLPEFVHT